MVNPATILVKLSGERITNVHHLYVAAALEHFYCSVFTILHRLYENEEELNRALISPYAEVPQDYQLELIGASEGSIIIDYKLMQTIAFVLVTIGGITWTGIRVAKDSLETYKTYQEIKLHSIEIEKKERELESQKVDKSKKSAQQYNVIHIEGLRPLEPISTEGDDPLPISVTIVEDLKKWDYYRRLKLNRQQKHWKEAYAV
jgi:hypothetical protein